MIQLHFFPAGADVSDSIQTSYDPWLVVLSIFVASLASYVALKTAERMGQNKSNLSKMSWLILGSLSMGLGIWAMHFLGMIAFRIPATIYYEKTLTFLSIAPAIIASGIALWVMNRDRIGILALNVGGLLMGSGIGVMHYVGMSAMVSNALMMFDPVLFAFSILVAHVLATLALHVKFIGSDKLKISDGKLQLVSSLIMGCAIAGMHYTGMGAAYYFPGSESIELTNSLVTAETLGLPVTTIAIFVMAIAITLALIERRMQITLASRDFSEKCLNALLENLIDGVIVIDSTGTMQSVNPAVVALFGYSEQEILGKNIRIMMPEPYSSKHDTYLREYLNTGDKKVIGIGREVVGQKKDGDRFPMELSVTEMFIDEQRMFTGVIRDISIRKKSEAALRLNDYIFQSSDDAIMSKDLEGFITAWNPGAERMFGYTADEAIGRPMLIIFPEDRKDEEKKILEKIIRGEKIEHFETVRKRKDSSVFDISVTVSPIVDESGNILGASKIARDITEKKKIETIKSEFVSTVSHELRTPLTSIKGAISLLKSKFSKELPAKAQEMLAMASRNVDRLTLLINDILDLEKIESGRMEFVFDAVDLAYISKQAIKESLGFAEEHDVKLVFKGEVNQATVNADEHRLLQVFANLISNAVKYSPKNDVVTVSVEKSQNGVKVMVSDNGAGIPKEFRSRIFQRFAQADSSDTREKGGTGLGLSISKAIIGRHEGTMGYDSSPGQATSFYFELPEQHMVQESKLVKTGSRRILICEDNLDVAKILSEMIESEVSCCDIVTTGTAAIEQALKHNYSLLLLDLNLPDACGLEVIDQLKANPETSELPIIIVSGHADKTKAVFTGDAVTVVDWLQKPVERERLERALKEALSRVEKLKILHVEDDMDIVQIVTELVQDSGKIFNSDSVAGARKLLNEEQFDLVILDIGLTDGSGLDLLVDIKQKCPIVIFSAQMPSREVTAQVAAALTKSMTDNEELLGAIKNALNQKDATL